MSAYETLFSFVNCWECDENDHLNVQFYMYRFDEADRQFRLLSGLTDSVAGPRRARHVRFHNELFSGDTIAMTSHIAFDGPYMLTVVHELRRTADGSLAATAIDGYGPADSMARELRRRFADASAPMPDAAQPRGTPASGDIAAVTPAQLEAAGGRVTNRATVLPRHAGPDGRADDCFATGCFVEADPHTWNMTPMSEGWLAQHNLGRVVAELKICWAGPLKVGEPAVTYSGLTGAGSTTFSIRHHMFEARTQRLVAVADIVGLALDLDTRKAVRLDEEVRSAILKATLKR